MLVFRVNLRFRFLMSLCHCEVCVLYTCSVELAVLHTHSDVLWLLWAPALNIPKCSEALSVRNSLLSQQLSCQMLQSSSGCLPPILKLLNLLNLGGGSRTGVSPWWYWKLPITLTVKHWGRPGGHIFKTLVAYRCFDSQLRGEDGSLVEMMSCFHFI